MYPGSELNRNDGYAKHESEMMRRWEIEDHVNNFVHSVNLNNHTVNICDLDSRLIGIALDHAMATWAMSTLLKWDFKPWDRTTYEERVENYQEVFDKYVRMYPHLFLSIFF